MQLGTPGAAEHVKYTQLGTPFFLHAINIEVNNPNQTKRISTADSNANPQHYHHYYYYYYYQKCCKPAAFVHGASIKSPKMRISGTRKSGRVQNNAKSGAPFVRESGNEFVIRKVNS